MHPLTEVQVLNTLQDMPSRSLGKERVLPTGKCWCGCGADVAIGSFFAQGHDKIAESAVILTLFGSVPQFLVEFGFGPGGLNPAEELRRWREASRKAR